MPGPKVLLLSMPWAPLHQPSLALGILKAKLLEAEISCTVRHLNIFLLQYLKVDSYRALADRWALNDFLFTQVLEGDVVAPDQLEALDAMLHKPWERVDLRSIEPFDSSTVVQYALKVRNEAIPRFLDDCLAVIDDYQPSMIGFTCMFDQTFASLALATLVKRRHPEILIVFGGYALELPVGPQLIRSFGCVDAVALGEGEHTIVPLAEASFDRTQLLKMPGVIDRNTGGEPHAVPRGQPVNLDASPVPDYDDFVSDVEELSLRHEVDIPFRSALVESSRGCWWGQVSHCVFCGIDDETMRYRFKSPLRVQSILHSLQQRYGKKKFCFADYIMPRQYYKSLLPALAEAGAPYSLFWEMKSNVRAEEIALMKRAGVDSVQAGIESFSSGVLRKMSKGVSAIQNVFTIKMLMQNNMDVNYNIIYGFPTDDANDYREMVTRIPLLYHLTPPISYVPVLTTRFAPLQADPARFGITRRLTHADAYDMILSKAYRERIGFELDDYCYIFETPYNYNEECRKYYDILVYQISHWRTQQAMRLVRLSYVFTNDGIEYTDSRYDENDKLLRFGLPHAAAQRALAGSIVSRHELAAEVAKELDDPSLLEAILDDFRRERLLFEEGDRVVGLAFPAACYETWIDLAMRERRQYELTESSPT